ERSSRLQRTIQHRRSLHEGDHVKQDNERAERERNRDRPRASAALLLFAEDNSLRLFVHITKAPLTPRGLLRRPRPATPRRGRIDRGLRKRRDRAPLARHARRHARRARARRTRPSARRREARSPRRLSGHSREATAPRQSARVRWNRAKSFVAFPPARQP